MKVENLHLTKLQNYDIKEGVYSGYDILILPENIFRKKADEALMDSEDSIDLYKYLKANGIKAANSKELKLDSKMKERRGGNELWLGVIYFIQQGIVSIYWSLLSRFLYDKIKVNTDTMPDNEKLKTSAKEKQPNATNIHIKIVSEDYNIEYNGDAKMFMKIVKEFKK